MHKQLTIKHTIKSLIISLSFDNKNKKPKNATTYHLLFAIGFVFKEHLRVFCRVMTVFIFTFFQWSVYAPFMFILVFPRQPHRPTYFTFKTFPRMFLHVADKVGFMFKLPCVLFPTIRIHTLILLFISMV